MHGPRFEKGEGEAFGKRGNDGGVSQSIEGSGIGLVTEEAKVGSEGELGCKVKERGFLRAVAKDEKGERKIKVWKRREEEVETFSGMEAADEEKDGGLGGEL